jgi:hypothetical protein
MSASERLSANCPSSLPAALNQNSNQNSITKDYSSGEAAENSIDSTQNMLET